jgi:HAD superfamily hydrolase (TIGR01490 family)
LPAAAFFDVDGTLARSDIVRTYVHLRTRGLAPLARLGWLARYLPKVVRLLWIDRSDRARMNVELYRGYAGMRLADVSAAMIEDYHEVLGRRVFPGARARIAEHRLHGDRVVLVSGSLDFVIAPLAAELGADDVLAARMEVRDGVLTGRLIGPPFAGTEKERRVREFAAARGIDLAASTAYGDSLSDLPVLELAGHAVAVNPDRSLARVARARGFTILHWEVAR